MSSSERDERDTYYVEKEILIVEWRSGEGVFVWGRWGCNSWAGVVRKK